PVSVMAVQKLSATNSRKRGKRWTGRKPDWRTRAASRSGRSASTGRTSASRRFPRLASWPAPSGNPAMRYLGRNPPRHKGRGEDRRMSMATGDRPMTGLRFAGLIRVSGEKQEKKGESLATQRASNARDVVDLGGTIVEVYGGQEHATPGWEKKEVDRLIRDA